MIFISEKKSVYYSFKPRITFKSYFIKTVIKIICYLMLGLPFAVSGMGKVGLKYFRGNVFHKFAGLSNLFF